MSRIPLHPAAWVGFLLNCFVALIFMDALSGVDLSQLPEEQRMILAVITERADTIRMIFYAVLGIQALALGLLATRKPYGLAAAFIGALLMLPGSLLYLVGCLLTHYRNKYLDFAPAPPGYTNAQAVFSSAAAPKLRMASSVTVALSFLAIFAGWMNMAAVCFGAALAGLYFAIRSRKNAPLAIFDKYITLTPAIYVSSLLVPFNSIRLATLRPDSSIVFNLDSPKGPLILTWPLNSVAEPERRQAMEELADALSENGVTLEQEG